MHDFYPGADSTPDSEFQRQVWLGLDGISHQRSEDCFFVAVRQHNQQLRDINYYGLPDTPFKVKGYLRPLMLGEY